jgi:hypothetical protein
VFGAYPGMHCAVLVGSGARAADPWAVSHGGPGDPKRIRLSGLADSFRADGPVVFLQLVSG